LLCCGDAVLELLDGSDAMLVVLGSCAGVDAVCAGAGCAVTGGSAGVDVAVCGRAVVLGAEAAGATLVLSEAIGEALASGSRVTPRLLLVDAAAPLVECDD
jgi:hypothetical protein